MGAQAMLSGGAISRQGSLCSLTLSDVEGQLHGVNLLRTAGGSRRTVDEVWRDIQGTASCGRPQPAQMTLEDFLSMSGGGSALAADAGGGGGWTEQYNPPPPVPEQQQRHSIGRPLPRPLGVGAGPVLDALYHDHDGAAMSGRKRAAVGGLGEKIVERRKKRMIKNRESAAYANELENKISLLEEENERLRNHKFLYLSCAPFYARVVKSEDSMYKFASDTFSERHLNRKCSMCRNRSQRTSSDGGTRPASDQ